jgi:hypothetical protein
MQDYGSGSKVLFVTAVLIAATAGGYMAMRSTATAIGGERVGQAPTAKDPATANEEKAIRKAQASYLDSATFLGESYGSVSGAGSWGCVIEVKKTILRVL